MSFDKAQSHLNEDALLWQGLSNGDEIAFDKLINKYFQILFSYGTRFCQDRDIVKDCIQELFVELWNKRNSIQEPNSVKWYLIVATRNRIFREQTKWNKNQSLNDDEYDFLFEYSIEKKIIEHADDIELAEKVKKTLESLPPRQKEIIYLRYYENLDFDQISVVMDISRQSAHNLLQKAYKNIRSEWSLLICLLQMLATPYLK